VLLLPCDSAWTRTNLCGCAILRFFFAHYQNEQQPHCLMPVLTDFARIVFAVLQHTWPVPREASVSSANSSLRAFKTLVCWCYGGFHYTRRHFLLVKWSASFRWWRSSAHRTSLHFAGWER
jgi:hypothetical protein